MKVLGSNPSSIGGYDIYSPIKIKAKINILKMDIKIDSSDLVCLYKLAKMRLYDDSYDYYLNIALVRDNNTIKIIMTRPYAKEPGSPSFEITYLDADYVYDLLKANNIDDNCINLYLELLENFEDSDLDIIEVNIINIEDIAEDVKDLLNDLPNLDVFLINELLYEHGLAVSYGNEDNDDDDDDDDDFYN